MKKNLKKGFTLIELLVVIAIIGILAGVVLANLNTARSRSKDASAKASMSSVRGSAEIYYNGGGANAYGPSGNGASGTVTNTGTLAGLVGACADSDVTKLLKAS